MSFGEDKYNKPQDKDSFGFGVPSKKTVSDLGGILAVGSLLGGVPMVPGLIGLGMYASGFGEQDKDKFGFGTEIDEDGIRNAKIFEYTLLNAGIDPQSSQENLWNIYNDSHKKVWKKFINKNIDSQSYKDFKNSWEKPKQFILREKISEKDYRKLVEDDDFKKIQALDSVFDSWN